MLNVRSSMASDTLKGRPMSCMIARKSGGSLACCVLGCSLILYADICKFSRSQVMVRDRLKEGGA